MSRARTALGPDVQIPEKLYFKIGEVSLLVGVRAHVLRYWEKEVPSIRPGKSASNQRRYRRKDVEIFREIRRLLHSERYTLAGARKRIMSGERIDEAGELEAHESELALDTHQDDDASPSLPGSVELSIRDDASLSAASRHQLALGFAAASSTQRLQNVRAGLRELIRLAGEDP